MHQLRKLGDLSGYRLHALDGEIGKLQQIYFDDQYWTVRYFVVRTGSWLLEQDVLIVPAVIKSVDEKNRCLKVNLTREQIKNSPPTHTQLPVSRHYEQEYYRYYGWEPYWNSGSLFGSELPMAPPIVEGELKDPEYPHLRSSDEVQGYRLHALDGKFGHVEDFILEDPDWAIRYLVIDTRNWLPGKKVLIAPAWIRQVDWVGREVMLILSCEVIKTAPVYDATKVISPDYQVALYKHYGMALEEEVEM